jgi:hypothetical protein
VDNSPYLKAKLTPNKAGKDMPRNPRHFSLRAYESRKRIKLEQSSCPRCGSPKAQFLGIANRGSKELRSAIPVLGIKYTINEPVAYYACKSCNTTYYRKPTKED